MRVIAEGAVMTGAGVLLGIACGFGLTQVAGSLTVLPISRAARRDWNLAFVAPIR